MIESPKKKIIHCLQPFVKYFQTTKVLSKDRLAKIRSKALETMHYVNGSQNFKQLITFSFKQTRQKNIFYKLQDMREIINIQLGQCGNNIGYDFLQSIAEEHSISAEAVYTGTTDYQRQRISVFFNQHSNNTFTSRSILVDLEPGTIDNIRGKPFGSLYNCDNFKVGMGSAGNNWAQGYYGAGAELIEYIMDSVRNQADSCENLEGFQVIQSIGGGTGSGLGSLVMQKIRDEYSQKIIQTFTVLPNQANSSSSVQPYNAVFCFPTLIQRAQMCHLLSNQAIEAICMKKKKISSPTYKDLNNLVANVMSGVSSGIRFPGQINSSLRKIAVNLVPFPRLHFFSNSISPYLSNKVDPTRKNSFQQIITELFDNSTSFSGIKRSQGRYLTASVVLRGKASTYQAQTYLKKTQDNNSSYFVEWIPDNISVSYCSVPIQKHETSGVLVGNHVGIKKVYKKLSQRFVALYRKKAFVHWYTSQGMDEMQFTQSQSILNDLHSECDWDSCGCDGYDSEQQGMEGQRIEE